MFDPSIGRWISADPVGFEAGDVNLYRYVGNDPAGKTDPSGTLYLIAPNRRPYYKKLFEDRLKLKYKFEPFGVPSRIVVAFVAKLKLH